MDLHAEPWALVAIIFLIVVGVPLAGIAEYVLRKRLFK